MRKFDFSIMKGGWFVGNFEPTAFKTKDCEVAYVKHFKDTHPQFEKVNLTKFDLRKPKDVMGDKRWYSLPKETRNVLRQNWRDKQYSLNLGKNLSSFAISKNDNTIEGLIHNELSIIGVMWHPERNPDTNSHILLKKFFLK